MRTVQLLEPLNGAIGKWRRKIHSLKVNLILKILNAEICG
jgi:hypothetical protein